MEINMQSKEWNRRSIWMQVQSYRSAPNPPSVTLMISVVDHLMPCVQLQRIRFWKLRFPRHSRSGRTVQLVLFVETINVIIHSRWEGGYRMITCKCLLLKCSCPFEHIHVPRVPFDSSSDKSCCVETLVRPKAYSNVNIWGQFVRNYLRFSYHTHHLSGDVAFDLMYLAIDAGSVVWTLDTSYG